MPIRDWQIDFDPLTGLAGDVKTISHRCQSSFRGEKAMATDTSSSPGRGTRIRTVFVGQRLQRPALTDSLTLFFTETALANGLLWDWADRGERIEVTVSFIEACTFSMSVFGSSKQDY